MSKKLILHAVVVELFGRLCTTACTALMPPVKDSAVYFILYLRFAACWVVWEGHMFKCKLPSYAFAVWVATRVFSSRQQLAANSQVSAEAWGEVRRFLLFFISHFCICQFSVVKQRWTQLLKLAACPSKLTSYTDLHFNANDICSQSFNSDKLPCVVVYTCLNVYFIWFNNRDHCYFVMFSHNYCTQKIIKGLHSLSQTMMDNGLTAMLWLTSRFNQSLICILCRDSKHPILLD